MVRRSEVREALFLCQTKWVAQHASSGECHIHLQVRRLTNMFVADCAIRAWQKGLSGGEM